jgi:5-methylcytosine-specific restriction endonuclease McrA
MTRLQRHCLTCNRLIGPGRCPVCGRTSVRGYDSEWRRLSARILERDGHRCQLRLPGCTTLATTVDHTTPLSRGGARLDTRNLVAACRVCNSRKGDRP